MFMQEMNSVFSALDLPVIVCSQEGDWPIVYMNMRASMIFQPSYSVDTLTGQQGLLSLGDIFDEGSEQFTALRQIIAAMGHVENFACETISFNGAREQATLYGNRVEHGAEGTFYVFYVMHCQTGQSGSADSQLSAIINTALTTQNMDESIKLILGLAAQHASASRVYIFEEISPTTTRNTYEWCAPGIEPAIQDLQNLQKADYNYDVIVESGMYITRDVTALPEGDRDILQAQGICALAIVTLYDEGKPIGYVGFDDCEKVRQWDQDEIQYLRGISAVLALLIKRRDAEHSAQRTREILQLISDNSDDIVYVSDLDDYSLLFASKAAATSLGITMQDMKGKKCYEVFQKGFEGPCSFCPIPKLKQMRSNGDEGSYVWERTNTINGADYLVRDNIISWVDGKTVHVETAVDISRQKETEVLLRHYATTDLMTGVIKRDWGANMLEKMFADPPPAASLCFIDLDGLKHTNDHYGHEAGDMLLVESARIISENIGQDDFFCRWGGDEFLLVLNCDTDAANKLIGVIQEQMRRYNDAQERQFSLSFSYGIVPFNHEQGDTLDALVTQADQAMYENKMHKKGLAVKRRRDD